ncbi:MAG: dihydrodipicolinate reductase C-terminal domain-containing protein [Alphaproteobacteria bacterium]
MTLKIGILGFGGRMGQLLAAEAQRHPGCTLAALYWRQKKDDTPIPEGCLVSNDLDAVIAASDALIEFTTAEASPIFAAHAAKLGKPLVTGTTGLSDAQQEAIKAAAQRIPLLQAPNTSLSLAVTKQLTTLAAKLLRGRDYDIGITDIHHRHKKDAPSGTAKALGAAVLAGNPDAKPSYAAHRLGNIVGEHEVIFAGTGEVLTIHHSVTDRAIFARGAIAAALWLHGQKPGLYGMNDMLGV